MRAPCCSVCQNKYNEEERCPLLLQCGHGFCRECLSKMFSASPDSSLSCPRCRHVSTVGNSVSALKKNYAVLSLIQGGDDDDEDDEDDDLESNEGGHDRNFIATNNFSCGSSSNVNSTSGGGSFVHNNGIRRVEDGVKGRRIDLGVHKEVKMVRRIGEGISRRAGVEMWAAIVSGRGCKHKMAVKKVAIGKEETEVAWMQGQLEDLKRKSMWCRNVCTFHGTTRIESSLCLVMDRCHGSVETAMQRNGGRLTLEQILRFRFRSCTFYGMCCSKICCFVFYVSADADW